MVLKDNKYVTIQFKMFSSKALHASITQALLIYQHYELATSKCSVSVSCVLNAFHNFL